MPAAQHAAAAVDAPLGPEVVLIPVKAFHQAKRRLGSALSDPERVRLVRAMATQVVAACVPLPVAVVCDDEEVAHWASELGAAVMWEPGQGLNGAVRAGVDRLARAGAELGDGGPRRPAPSPRAGRARPVRRRHPRARPARRRHQRAPAAGGAATSASPTARARSAPTGPRPTRLGLAVRVLRDPDLAYDVDWPADVDELGRPS